MLKRLLLSVSVVTLSLIAYQSKAQAAIQFPESCRMGECSVGTLDSKEALRSNEFGTLYLINTSGSSYPQTTYPESAARDYELFVNYYGTDYVTGSSQSYVFCSTSIPSVLFEADGEYVMKRLALFEPPSNADRDSHEIYLATCHNLAGPDYFSFEVQTLLIREGYTTRYVSQDEQVNVPNILEMMELYPDSY